MSDVRKPGPRPSAVLLVALAMAERKALCIDCGKRSRIRPIVDGALEAAFLPTLGEVLRLYAVDQLESGPAEALARRLAEAYAGGEGSAASVIGEVESAVDRRHRLGLVAAGVELRHAHAPEAERGDGAYHRDAQQREHAAGACAAAHRDTAGSQPRIVISPTPLTTRLRVQ